MSLLVMMICKIDFITFEGKSIWTYNRLFLVKVREDGFVNVAFKVIWIKH
jgi:hypothetical protein